MGDRWARDWYRRAGRTERAVGAAKACLSAGRRAEVAMMAVEGWSGEVVILVATGASVSRSARRCCRSSWLRSRPRQSDPGVMAIPRLAEPSRIFPAYQTSGTTRRPSDHLERSFPQVSDGRESLATTPPPHHPYHIAFTPPRPLLHTASWLPGSRGASSRASPRAYGTSALSTPSSPTRLGEPLRHRLDRALCNRPH